MPGFIGHTTGNAVALVGTTAYMIYDKWSWADVATVGAGMIVATIILSPDMDLFNSRSMDDWGWMRIFWWPYAKFVKHRDRLHIPVLGTSVRWLYMAAVLSIIVVPLWIILKRSNFVIAFQGDTNDIYWYLGYVADLLIGATIADAIHFVLDITSTALKRNLGISDHHHHDRYPLASIERRQRMNAMNDPKPNERDNEWNKNSQNSRNNWGR
jgi:uncharacterized metal-binding protein